VNRPELQTAASNLGSNLQNLAATLSSQRQLFSTQHAYPLGSFPGHAQGPLLEQLLRKKLDPRAEDWISESLFSNKKARDGKVTGQDGSSIALSAEDTTALWSWAGTATSEMRMEMEDAGSFRDDYTLAERQAGISSVVTGIRRKLGRDLDSEDEDEDNDEDEDEDENMEVKDEEMKDGHDAEDGAVTIASREGFNVALPPIPLDTLLRFATGSNPLQAGTST
jgi:mediator of RNA polymerase II transcription subunit 8